MLKCFTLMVSLLVLLPCFATEPFPDSVTASKDGKYSVRIKAWEDEKERLLFIKTPKGTTGLTMKELGFDAGLEVYPSLTTAGWDWYQNSITHIDTKKNIFALRLKSSRTILIDLSTRTVVEQPTKKIIKEIERIFAKSVVKMLESKDPEERETGSIFAGQLKLKETIPKLKELLADRSWFTQISGDEEPMVILYVRQAAKVALGNLGQKVDGVVTEVPKKGHVIEKDYSYVLRLDGDKVEKNDTSRKTSDDGNNEKW